MRHWSCCLLALALVCRASAAPPAVVEADVTALAERIDARIDAALKVDKIPTAPLASDAEYLRRVFLDVAGRIPTVAEVRAFGENRRKDRRRRLVERLLASPAYVNHFSEVWRAALLPQSLTNNELEEISSRMETWLHGQVKANVGYDRLVRALLTTPLPYQRLPVAGDGADPPPVAFFQANDLKVEAMTGTVARLFLGLQLQCAECHNHPFASWTRDQFWETAAFFAGVPPRDAAPGGSARSRSAEEPSTLIVRGTKRTVAPRFLDGKLPKSALRGRPRQAFAAWLTAPDNPYFARVAVNRLWAQFFGLGLVEPLDDFGPHNPPSHPQLLDDLAQAFVKHNHDVPFLIRAITASRAYQRTSASTHRGQDDPRRYARRSVKGLSAEQLFDSLAVATGYQDPIPRVNRPLFGLPHDMPRGEFLRKFAGAGPRADRETSILQALTLMNGKFVSKLTDPEQSRLLAAVAEAPFLDRAGKLETLFLATLSRPPTATERRRLLDRLARGDSRKALADVFWVLLNSPEFLLNH